MLSSCSCCHPKLQTVLQQAEAVTLQETSLPVWRDSAASCSFWRLQFPPDSSSSILQTLWRFPAELCWLYLCVWLNRVHFIASCTFIPPVSHLYPNCIPPVSNLYRPLSLMYPHCIPPVSHLYYNCIPPVSHLFNFLNIRLL